MNRSGVLKIAATIVVIVMGLSTLVVGLQLSSEGTAATAHKQVSTNPSTPSIVPGNSTYGTQQSSEGYADLMSNNSGFFEGSTPQRFMSGDQGLRCCFIDGNY
jgi:hypothetical protein